MHKKQPLVRLGAVLMLCLFALAPALPARAQGGAPPNPLPVCADPNLRPAEIATCAYVYGYPLVMMGVTQQVVTNTRDATTTLGRAPINQFAHSTQLPDASYVDVVLPNVNTLYSLAWLDLSREPIILHLPDNIGRFFLMEVVDGWTNVNPSSPGSRTGTPAGNYAFVGPGWRGTLPQGINGVYNMPTNVAWIIGRTYTTGTQDDINTIVNTIEPQYTLTPLNKFGKQYRPPVNAPLDPKVDMTTVPYAQVDRMAPGTFFKYMMDMMRANPPLGADAPVIANLAKIGLIPGRPFEINSVDAATRQALEFGAQEGNKLVNYVAFNPPVQPVNNWRMALNLGDFGTQYLLRAATARNGIGANYYLDAVYAGTGTDSTGTALNGQYQYTLTFAPGQLPPANPQAFWSVTMYNQTTENLVANAINRYAVGIPTVQGNQACPNADGTLTLYIQADPPGAPGSQAYCNWLPSPQLGAGQQPPQGNFLLLLRMYWPGPSLFDQTWAPPYVQRVP